MRRFVWARGLVLAALVLGLFLLRRQLHLAEYFSRENIGQTLAGLQAWVQGYGVWGPLVFVGGCAAATVVYFPIIIVVFVAVTLFGHLAGGLLSLLAAMLGCSLVHAIAHGLGRPAVERLFGGRMQDLEARVSRRELKNVLLLRLVLLANPILNWALGISGVSFRNMLLGTVLGLAPAVLILTWLSGEIVAFVQTGNGRSLLQHWPLLIPLVLAAALLRGNWFFARLERIRRPAAAELPP